MCFYWFYLMQFQLLSNGLKRFCLVFLSDKWTQHRWRIAKWTQLMAVGWLFGWISELVNEWRRRLMWDSLPKSFCNGFPLELFPTGTCRFSIILCGFSKIVFDFGWTAERLSNCFHWEWRLCSVTEIAIRRLDLIPFYHHELMRERTLEDVFVLIILERLHGSRMDGPTAFDNWTQSVIYGND